MAGLLLRWDRFRTTGSVRTAGESVNVSLKGGLSITDESECDSTVIHAGSSVDSIFQCVTPQRRTRHHKPSMISMFPRDEVI